MRILSLIASGLVGLAAFPAASAPAAADLDGQIINVGGGGRCLDVHAPDRTVNGGRVQLWTCNATEQQSWRYIEGTGELRNAAGLCLDVHAPELNTPGGRVQVWTCNNSPQQRFFYEESTGLLRAASGLCLGIHYRDRSRDGGAVSVYHCNNQPLQNWRFEVQPLDTSQPGSAGPIVSRFGQCLDVHAPDAAVNGGRVQVWTCNGSAQQTWAYNPRTSEIRNASGLCLDVHAPDIDVHGGRVQVWECNGAPQQRWRYADEVLYNDAGLCLGIDNPGYITDGIAVQVQRCSYSMNQKWYSPILRERG